MRKKIVAVNKLILCIICFLPSLIHAETLQNHKIKLAVGKYSTDESKPEVPLLSVSTDDGNTWNYSSVNPFPDKTKNSWLTSAGCTDNFCVVSGFSYENSQDSFQKATPILAISKDQGSTWSYISSLSKDYIGAFITNVNCNASFCIAVSPNYFDVTSPLPILAISSEDGSRWTTPDSIINNLHKKASFWDATCNENGCLAVGSDHQGMLNNSPLIAVSMDKGRSWNYPVLSGKENAYFSHVTCNQNSCIASGSSTNPEYKNYPIMAISHDKGLTWEYSKTFFSNMPGGVQQSYIESIKCNNNLCIAVGSYINDAHAIGEYPLLAVSNNNGKTWEYPKSIISDVHARQSAFEDVSCHDNFCVAIGKKDFYDPLIATSQDDGKNWSYVSNILPDFDAEQVNLVKISCTKESCIATGSYHNSHSGKLYPFLIISKDQGMTWSFPKTIMSALPADFYDHGSFAGNFNGSGSNLKLLFKK